MVISCNSLFFDVLFFKWMSCMTRLLLYLEKEKLRMLFTGSCCSGPFAVKKIAIINSVLPFYILKLCEILKVNFLPLTHWIVDAHKTMDLITQQSSY